MSATFLDFDGTLADTNLVQVCAFYCRHAGAPGDAVGRQTKLLANVPAFLALDKINRAAFARRLFSFYRGLSQDRLERLSRRMHDEVIAPRVFPAAREFLDGCRRTGPLVLVTGATDFSVRHFAEEYGIEHVIATRLEFRDGVATGRVVPPSVFGSNKARLLREWAREREVDLERSAAYADSISDASMLDAVGRGGVINPNRRLAALAKDYHWQILNFD